MTSGRVAAIDVGTNTVLLLVAEGTGAAPRAVLELATITRLGEGVDRTGRLGAAAMERTLATLSSYAERFRELGVERVAAVCTSAARDAENGGDFLHAATRVLGRAPRIVDGDEEARLTFDGALTGIDAPTGSTVFDVGGGSTELIVGAKGGAGVRACLSIDVGSVRLTERHVQTDPPTGAELDAVRDAVTRALATVPFRATTPLVGVAGTVTTLSAIAQNLSTYDSAAVHGSHLSREAILRLTDELARMPLPLRKKVTGLPEARADVIVAGAVIVGAIVEWASATEIVVSDRGVRWGIARRELDELART
jgi:exopolyphosphatase/guanosine-5'-triphosphate,3'-diphosphate pyrophosphatase